MPKANASTRRYARSAPVAPAIEAISPPVPDSAPVPQPSASPQGKIGMLVTLLQHPEGATMAAMTTATGWQAHSVRGAISGSVRKAHGHTVVREKRDAGRIWRIVGGPGA